MKKSKPRKTTRRLTEAERQELRRQALHDRRMPTAAERDAYLRALMNLPPRRVFSDGTSIRDEP